MSKGALHSISVLLKRRKINVFLVFFLISFIVWTLVKLSNIYTDTITMKVAYTNLSEDKILLGNQQNMLQAQVKASGFRILRQKLFKKEIEVDLKKVSKTKTDDIFYVLSDAAINKHLYQGVEILRVSPDTLYVKLGKNVTKQVPVVHRLKVQFQKGYNLYDSLRIEPAYINVSGPEDVMAQIDTIYTEKKIIKNISSNIKEELTLLENDSLDRISYEQYRVNVIAKVEKFTEGKLTVPLRVRNLPKGYSIKLFPNEVTVTYTANVSDFNDITVNDFAIFCDYKSIENTENSFFIPQLEKVPKKVKSYRVENQKINFLIKK